MRLEAQLSLAKRAEFDLAPLASLRPPQHSADGDSRVFVQSLPGLARRKAQVGEASSDRADGAKSKKEPLAEPRLSTELRIELDELARRFVYRRFDPPDPEPVFQFPSERQLAFSRALNAALRAVQQAELDLRV